MTLILVWFAISQSVHRPTEYYPQVTMQQFATKDKCEQALTFIKKMANGKKIEGVCV